MLADSHCHLQLIDYTKLDQDLNQTVQVALDNGVNHFLCVATHLDQEARLKEIAEQFETVKISMGLHPNETIDLEPTENDFTAISAHNDVVAIGETGLDYYRTEGDYSWQQERFRVQIRAAKKLNKPLIIHTRAAKQDTIKIMKEEVASDVGGVMHCFTEDWEMAKAAMDLGFYISFSGIVTFKNAGTLQEVAKQVPLDKMLIETDCPYLAPEPMRGKINQPSYVRHTAEFLAVHKGVSFEELALRTTENYKLLFKIK